MIDPTTAAACPQNRRENGEPLLWEKVSTASASYVQIHSVKPFRKLGGAIFLLTIFYHKMGAKSMLKFGILMLTFDTPKRTFFYKRKDKLCG